MAKQRNQRIEIVSYNKRNSPENKKRLASSVMALIFIMATVSAGTVLLLGVMDSDNGEMNTEDIKAVIDQGREIRLWEGEEVTLTAVGSRGEIDRYVWDMDGTTTTGSTFTHRFRDPGPYTVGLRVFDKQENSSRTSILIRVDHREEDIQGSTSNPSSLMYTRNFGVVGVDGLNTLASRIDINVVYPQGTPLPNRLNLTVLDGNGTLVSEGTYHTSSASGENIINWTLSTTQWMALYTPGEWTITIIQESPLAVPNTVSFTIDLYVLY